MSNSVTKVYSSRDGATSLLRKMGIKSRDYDKLIEITPTGKYQVAVSKAERHLEGLKIKKEAAIVARAGRRKTDPVIKRTDGSTVSSLIRQLILAGKSNKECFAEAKRVFGLEDNKKHYPSWYRSELKRSGQLQDN